MLKQNLQGMIFQKLEPFYAASLEDGFKELLERKHLYQSIRIQPPENNILKREITEVFSGSIPPPDPHLDLSSEFFNSTFSNVEWEIKNPNKINTGGYDLCGQKVEEMEFSVHFTPQSVKLFCAKCNRTEPYNFGEGNDLLYDFRDPTMFTYNVNEQAFSLAYQCQSCKSTPEIFLVHRNKLKLTLSGRVPMETVEVPTFLPKNFKKFFSDAIIAYNSGQTLAGIFLLRTFIEQVVRGQSTNPDSRDIEQLFTDYKNSLPGDFNKHFPSLKIIYDKLSEDLHGATGSIETFSKGKEDIEKHFEAKKIFDI